MVLVKVEDFYPKYREYYSGFGDIKSFDIYAEGHEKVGSVSDTLVDEDTGRSLHQCWTYFFIQL